MLVWSLGNKKILIIDDIPDMRSMMRSIVASLGAKDISTARNGDDAVSQLASSRFDIVLCDYNLGEGKDGQQVLEEARYRELLPYTTAFIMITAENSPLMVFAALEHAPDEYLSKPVTRMMLLTRLRNLLQKKDRLHLVLEAMDRRCWSTALQRCEALMESSSEIRSDLQQLKGNLLLELGEFKLAAAFYNELIAVRSLPWMSLGLGKALLYDRRYDNALALLDGLAQSQPKLVATYDLLTDTLIHLGDYGRARAVLKQGIAISPKTATRHRQYGQIAYLQGDYDTAESSFKSSLRLSKGSCLRSPGEYIDLASTLIKKNDSVTAIKTLRDMLKEFRQDPGTQAQGAMMELLAQSRAGGNESGEQALAEAFELFKNQPALISLPVALLMAELCFERKQIEFGKQLLGHVLRNQPDNPIVNSRVLELFTNAGMDKDCQQMIDAITKELAEIKQQGTLLALQGNHEEAIAFFEEAANALPENTELNLNAAHRLINLMQQGGKTPESMQKAGFYLDRIRSTVGVSAQYRQLKTQYNQLAGNM